MKTNNSSSTKEKKQQKKKSCKMCSPIKQSPNPETGNVQDVKGFRQMFFSRVPF